MQHPTTLLCYNGPIGNGDKHNHLKRKIGIAGASETVQWGGEVLDTAKELGREIVRQGGIVITGAESGVALWASMGAKEERGIVIGVSPAVSEEEHVNVYRYPLDYTDLIIYTGFGLAGRDLLFTRSCDAIIIGAGRTGTVHEFTVAYEDEKPIGVLEGPGSVSDIARDIIARGGHPTQNVIFSSDPKELITKLMQMLEERKVPEAHLR
jgi:uncharacterized protein (TIGR00725 family)